MTYPSNSGDSVEQEIGEAVKGRRLKAVTQEDAVGAKVAAIVDQAAATACEQINAFRVKLDQMEQMLLTNAAKVKSELTDHINLGEDIVAETTRLDQSIESMRERFNLPKV